MNHCGKSEACMYLNNWLRNRVDFLSVLHLFGVDFLSILHLFGCISNKSIPYRHTIPVLLTLRSEKYRHFANIIILDAIKNWDGIKILSIILKL